MNTIDFYAAAERHGRRISLGRRLLALDAALSDRVPEPDSAASAHAKLLAAYENEDLLGRPFEAHVAALRLLNADPEQRQVIVREEAETALAALLGVDLEPVAGRAHHYAADLSHLGLGDYAGVALVAMPLVADPVATFRAALTTPLDPAFLPIVVLRSVGPDPLVLAPIETGLLSISLLGEVVAAGALQVDQRAIGRAEQAIAGRMRSSDWSSPDFDPDLAA